MREKLQILNFEQLELDRFGFLTLKYKERNYLYNPFCSSTYTSAYIQYTKCPTSTQRWRISVLMTLHDARDKKVKQQISSYFKLPSGNFPSFRHYAEVMHNSEGKEMLIKPHNQTCWQRPKNPDMAIVLCRHKLAQLIITSASEKKKKKKKKKATSTE